MRQAKKIYLFDALLSQNFVWFLIIPSLLFLQLLLIHHPYLAINETWRQADVAAVARNFARESMNIFFPRVDARAELTGICGMEFPLYNYIVALMYKISGIVWLGFAKLFSVFCSWVSVYFLYQFAKKDPVVGQRIDAKLFVLICFSVPFFYLYSGLVMPEMLALALGSAGLYYFSCYKTQRVSIKYLVFASFLFSLSMLVRPYYAFFGFVMFVDFFMNLKKSPKTSLLLAIFGILILLPFVAWYHFWVPYLNKQYGLGGYFYMGDSLVHDSRSFFHFFIGFAHQIVEEFFIFIYVPLFFLGIFWRLKIEKTSFLTSLNQPFFQVIYMAFLAWIALTFIASIQYGHFHYLGAVFPAVALGVSFAMTEALKRVKENNRMILLAAFCFVFTASYFIAALRALHLYHSDRDFSLLLQQKNSLLAEVPISALIVVDSVPDRSYMYLLDRKGWIIDSSQLVNKKASFAELKKRGAQYLIEVPKWQHGYQTSYTLKKL